MCKKDWETNHSVTVLDLYKKQLIQSLYLMKKKRRDLVNEEETARWTLVEEADMLLFIYPICGGGDASYFKGFIDRIFVAGFAYKYEGPLPKGY